MGSVMEKHRPLPAHRLREIAYHSSTDPRTVERVIRGMPTRNMPRERVVAALRAAGLENLVPEQPDAR